MKKTKELIGTHLKLVDVVVELLDARIPLSSRNPVFDELLKDKPRIVALNKFDLADPVILKKWVQHYKNQGILAIPIDSIDGTHIRELLAAIKDQGLKKQQKYLDKGMEPRSIRVMIVGIPNVGKSTLINKLVGKKSAKTGDKPGVTRGKQWIRIREDIDLFDTPGILWPKIDDLQVGLNLAFTGAIKDEIIPVEETGLYLVTRMMQIYPGILSARYQVDESLPPLEVLEAIGIKRGFKLGKQDVDYRRTGVLIIEDYRKGRLGKLSLESPE
jgi:ribosome biogenesis GTPase A